MIGLALQIGTANTKIGFVGESQPRLVSESLILNGENERQINHYEQQFFLRDREERLFGANIDVWRNDVVAGQIFKNCWQDHEKQLGQIGYTLQKEHYLKFMQSLVRQMKDVKQKNGNINQEGLQYALVVIEPVYLKKFEVIRFREIISSFVFQELRLSGLYFLKNSVATAYSEGKNCAIVVDSGHNFTTISRVVDGYNQKTQIYNFAGSMIDYELQKILKDRGLIQKTNFCKEKNRCPIFDRLCRMRELASFKQSFRIQENGQIQQAQQVILRLPDETEVKINRSDIREPFTKLQNYKQFNSDFWIPTAYSTIAKSVIQLLQEENGEYVDSIIFTGGNMLFSNIASRIMDQINRGLTVRKMGARRQIKSGKPLISNWIGGSIVGSIQHFNHYWVASNQYREHGISIVNKKCPL